ncbi:MAG: FAD binding domain-containing protein [Candidatus Acidiferrales bacterium]
MEPFAYASPSSVEEAIRLLGDHPGDAEILAGGTDLLARMKDYVSTPSRVISIAKIGALHGIRNVKGDLRIGAMVTFEQLLRSNVREHFPAIHEAVEVIAGPQIRNMGTIGGNLLQRPRCWYYRGGFGLLARDADGKSLVPNGDNRYHAILGNSGPAYFVSPSSLAPALIVFGASVTLHGPSGPREIPLEKFFVIPDSENAREHAIAPNEILTEISIPASSRGMRSSTYEVRQKDALDWPLATASVALRMNAARFESARIVLGHVAPIPWPATEAEKFLADKTITPESAAQAGEAAVAGAKPLSRNAYKVQLARVCVARALLAAAKGVA